MGVEGLRYANVVATLALFVALGGRLGANHPWGSNDDPCQYAPQSPCQNVAGEQQKLKPFIPHTETLVCPSGTSPATYDNRGDDAPFWDILGGMAHTIPQPCGDPAA